MTRAPAGASTRRPEALTFALEDLAAHEIGQLVQFVEESPASCLELGTPARVHMRKPYGWSKKQTQALASSPSGFLKSLSSPTLSPFVPDQGLSLREAVRLVAGLGGFLGRKSDGEPGAMTLWRGFLRLRAMVDGWVLARQSAGAG